MFVQGWSPRVLLSSLPKLEARRAGLLAPSDQAAAPAAGGRFGLVTGSRVVALDGHQAQVPYACAPLSVLDEGTARNRRYYVRARGVFEV